MPAVVALLSALLLGLVLAGPAAAHPLGLPAFARIAADGPRSVTLSWTAAPDDVAALARLVGVPVAGTVLTRAEDAALAAAPGLRDVALRDLRVEQGGAVCPAALDPVRSVVVDGLTVRAACPSPVSAVRVRVALLHAVDARYRTFGAAAGPEGVERPVFTATVPEQELQLDPARAADVPLPAPARPAADVRGAFGGALPLERAFVTAVDAPAGVLGTALALLVALGVGAVHALSPGHGKTVAAGWLVGERGRRRDAVVLGGTVALMHTASVLVLGLALFAATRRPDAARLSTALELVTGLAFAGLGAWLLARRVREPAGHAHAHPHAVPERPLSRQGVVALGAAGGLLPSPSALLVLLTALALDRVAYGLALVGAFSVGLAVTLTVVGLAVLRGRDALHERGGRLHALAHRAPVLGAAAVVVAGLALVVRALDLL